MSEYRDFEPNFCEVVVLSKYPEIFAWFYESLSINSPDVPATLVLDRSTGQKCYCPIGDNWRCVHVDTPFQIAKNANLGWSRAEPRDVVYAGDDTQIIEPNTIERLRAIAYSDPKIGIVAPRIKNHGYAPQFGRFTEEKFVAFVFVYIKREVIHAIGYMDESFTGYGWDDVDYCFRARRAGYKVGFANELRIHHGYDRHNFGSTFLRTKPEEEIWKEDEANMRRFCEKNGIPPNRSAAWGLVNG